MRFQCLRRWRLTVRTLETDHHWSSQAGGPNLRRPYRAPSVSIRPGRSSSGDVALQQLGPPGVVRPWPSRGLQPEREDQSSYHRLKEPGVPSGRRRRLAHSRSSSDTTDSRCADHNSRGPQLHSELEIDSMIEPTATAGLAGVPDLGAADWSARAGWYRASIDATGRCTAQVIRDNGVVMVGIASPVSANQAPGGFH